VPRILRRKLLMIVLACFAAVLLAGCGTLRGDEDVETEPREGRSDGSGLFTGKKGGVILDSEVWTGPTPSGDIAE